MSAGRRRNAVRWARYFNRYAHIPNVILGGSGCVRAMNYGAPRTIWYRVRGQQKHRFGEGYSVVTGRVR